MNWCSISYFIMSDSWINYPQSVSYVESAHLGSEGEEEERGVRCCVGVSPLLILFSISQCAFM